MSRAGRLRRAKSRDCGSLAVEVLCRERPDEQVQGGRGYEQAMISDVAASGVFLTGITGSLGSWLARKAIRAGWCVTALVRADDDYTARQRVGAALETAGAGELADEVRIIRGDLGETDIASRLAGLIEGPVERIVHCAADTKFDSSASRGNGEINLVGTERMLDLAARCGLAMTHVSTAYVAGRRAGVATEAQADVGQQFNNAYERSKLAAELAVRHWARRTGLPTVILRPSIVMGEAATGVTARFNPIGDLMRIVDLVVPHLGSQLLRIAVRPEVTKNMIPVDYFAAAAWHIITSRNAGCYHLTNPRPHTMRQIARIIGDLHERHQFCLVDPRALADKDQTPLERAINGATADYDGYMTDEPVFDRTNTDRVLAGAGIDLPAMGTEYFRRLLDYGRSVRWGKRRRPAARV